MHNSNYLKLHKGHKFPNKAKRGSPVATSDPLHRSRNCEPGYRKSEPGRHRNCDSDTSSII